MSAAEIFRDVSCFANGVDITGRTNEFKAGRSLETREAGTFEDGISKFPIPTRVGGQFEFAGLADETFQEERFLEMDGRMIECAVVLVRPVVAGVRSHSRRGPSTAFADGGAIGELRGYRLNLGDGPSERGRVLAYGSATHNVASGSVNVGSLLAGRDFVLVVHALSIDAGTVTFSLESDADDAFSTPIVRATTAALAAVSAARVRLAGPITDTRFRLVPTLGGGATTVTYLAMLNRA